MTLTLTVFAVAVFNKYVDVAVVVSLMYVCSHGVFYFQDDQSLDDTI
jgi:hypothetical protein